MNCLDTGESEIRTGSIPRNTAKEGGGAKNHPGTGGANGKSWKADSVPDRDGRQKESRNYFCMKSTVAVIQERERKETIHQRVEEKKENN